MGSKRIKGTKLSLKIDNTEYNGDATSYEFTHEDADAGLVTFADAADGNTKDWMLTVGLVQSTDPSSLFMQIWDNAGRTGVPYVLAPHGNATPTAAQPHFKGTLTLPLPARLGGEAGTAEYDTEAEFRLDGKPQKVTT